MHTTKHTSLELRIATGEVPDDSTFVLQSPQEFRDDFSAATSRTISGEPVLLEVMQFEDTSDTRPIFNAMEDAKVHGADVRFHYDRVALRHIRSEDGSQAYSYYGRNVVRFGSRSALREASKNRRDLTARLESRGISDAIYKKSGMYPRGTHNHIKIAVAGNTAWFGTMNLRGVDFEMSNFMFKMTDPDSVKFIESLFRQSEIPLVTEDQEHEVDEETLLLVDGGGKGESKIYDKALSMAISLESGDRFSMISQWPPARAMYGELADGLFERMKSGVNGEFLLSPPDKLHPFKPVALKLQEWVDRQQQVITGMSVINLARQTHAKALLIRRANGDSEVLFGSHNLSRWTVKNGTRELAMWSKDPKIVAQIEAFLDQVKAE